MRRSQFLRKYFKYGLNGLAIAAGLPVTITACSRSASRSVTKSAPESASESAASAAPAKSSSPPPAKEMWRVGIALGVAPFVSEKGQRLVGFDIDLIEAVGSLCGANLKLEAQPFDALMPLIQAGSIDVAIGALPIPVGRAEIPNFSQPYFRSGVAIAALPDNEQFDSLKALKGKTIAVQLETAGARLVIDIAESRILTFDQATAALKAVEAGEADAALVTLPALLNLLSTDSTVQVKQMGELTEPYDFGIIVRPIDAASEEERTESEEASRPDAAPQETRLNAINAALDTLVEDGTYAKIHQRWLGMAPL